MVLRVGFGTRASVRRMPHDPIWTESDLADLRRDFGDVYAGRTVLVTGADGFMGSHLTDALVELALDPERRAQLGAQAHLRARSAFSLEAMVERTLSVYAEATGP